MTTATELDDILNVDMLGLTHDDTSSPDSSFLAMPATPPQLADPAVSDLFKFYFDQHMSDLAKQGQQPMALPMPFTFGSPLFAQPSVAPSSDPNFFSIDPALMTSATPSTAAVAAPVASKSVAPRSASSAAGDDEDDEDLDDEDDDDIVNLLSRPIKVAGRGKAAGRKGTVAAGGIKKFGGQAVKDSDDPEDWRPTVDEYKKMTPKEKRQLRNKISARNFRVRRKEYITTLEGDVAERDNLIDLIREELGATKLENEALRREVDSLKRAMLEGRVELDLPPPAPLSPATNNTTTAKRATRSSKSSLPKANTRKDLARSGSSFWGGALGAGGVAQVHTTLVPDFTFDQLQENMNPAMNDKPFANDEQVASICDPFGNSTNTNAFDQFSDANPFTVRSVDQYRMQLWGRLAREAGPGALNVALGINSANAFAHSSHASAPSAASSPGSSNPGLASSSGSSRGSPSPPMAFASPSLAFSNSASPQLGINGLPLATMPNPILPGMPQTNLQTPHAPSGLAASMSPQWLDQEKKDRIAPAPTLGELLAKPSRSSSSSSNPYALKMPKSEHSTSSVVVDAKPEHMILAAAASQTLLAKMRDALWDAFALPSSSNVESKKKDWDTEKVRKVLDGTAVLQVVDVVQEKPTLSPKVETVTDPAAALEESMRALSLQRGASASAVAGVQMQTGGTTPAVKDAPASSASSGVDALTGVFAGLRLARTAGTARS